MIHWSTLIPFALGALGVLAGYLLRKGGRQGTLEQVLSLGGAVVALVAAVIGWVVL